MQPRQLLGIAGAALLIFGNFAPLVTFGPSSLIYFNDVSPVALLLPSVVALLQVLMERYRWLWLPAIICLGFVLYGIVANLSQLPALRAELAGNPACIPSCGEIQWGWAILLVGSILLAAAAFKKGTETPKTPPDKQSP